MRTFTDDRSVDVCVQARSRRYQNQTLSLSMVRSQRYNIIILDLGFPNFLLMNLIIFITQGHKNFNTAINVGSDVRSGHGIILGCCLIGYSSTEGGNCWSPCSKVSPLGNHLGNDPITLVLCDFLLSFSLGQFPPTSQASPLSYQSRRMKVLHHSSETHQASFQSPYVRANTSLLCHSRAPDSSVLQDQTRIYHCVETQKRRTNQNEDNLITDSEIWQKWCFCFLILKQVALCPAHDVPSVPMEQSLYPCLGQCENLIGQ